MKPITGDIKFFEANITHQRNGKKKHFFKNKTNAVLIDLENKSQQKIPKYPSLFSIKKFNLLGIPYQIIIGKNFNEQKIEFKEIDKQPVFISLEQITKIIKSKKSN